ncbi:unnamed protein product [Schistosoma haematobium]|nr:unnamed protein product [Schistosoma haematobium]CAH8666420.1 unnamed protein product [Schistosoma haematobium]
MGTERVGAVTELLTGHTIDELHRIVRQKRAEVEHKKDELRHLVGERHRDIIDASDRILLMKNLANEVSILLDQLRSYLTTWSRDMGTKKDPSVETQSLELSTASQLKLMLDIPELIWNYMDLGRHSSSARMLFLGRHLNARLNFSHERQLSHVNASVLVSRAWDSLVHMEAAVISAFRKRLSAPPSTKEELCDSLAALSVVGDLSTLQVLEEFFNGRKVGLYCLLGRDYSPHDGIIRLRPNFILSIRKQLLLVVRHILSTLEYLEFLFLPNTSGEGSTCKGALDSRIKWFVDWTFQDSPIFSRDRLYTHLPSDVLDFKLKDFKFSDEFSNFKQDEQYNLLIDLLRKLWDAWRDDSIQICREVLSESLSHVSSFETLVDLRTTALVLVQRLQTFSFKNGAKNCDTRPIKFDIWIELLRGLFLQRLEVLFTESFESSFNEWIDQFDQILVRDSKLKSEDNLSKMLSSKKPFFNSPIENSQFDWANFVWSDCLRDIDINDSSVVPDLFSCGKSKSEETSASSVSAWNSKVMSHLVNSNNVGLAVFCCLLHSPIPDSFALIENEHEHDFTSSAQLLVFLQRLVSENVPSLPGIILNGYTDLQKQLQVLSPELLALCEKLNIAISNHIIKLTLNVGQDAFNIWSLVFTALQKSMKQLEYWMTNKAYGSQSFENDCKSISVPLKVHPSCGILISRAWYALVNYCPSIIAASIAATGQIESIHPVHSDIENSDRLVHSMDSTLPMENLVWKNISLLRCKWESLSHSLFEVINQITFDSLVKGAVGHTILDEFRDSLCSTFLINSKQTDNEFKSDTKLDLVFNKNEVESLLMKYANTGAILSGIIPFEEVRLELHSSELTDVDGNSSAVVRIPSQLSLPTHHLLLNIVYTMGKFVVHKSLPIVDELLSHQDISIQCTDEASIWFSDSLQKSMQSRALQIMFDLKFLQRLLVSSVSVSEASLAQKNQMDVSSKRVQSMIQELTSRLETLVDPFDWNVCASKLSRNVANTITSTYHLYAPILGSSSFAQVETLRGIKAISKEETNDKSTCFFLPCISGTKNKTKLNLNPLPFNSSICVNKWSVLRNGNPYAKQI